MTHKTKLTFLALMSTGILGACGTESDVEEQASSSQESSESSQSEETSSESSQSESTSESSSNTSKSNLGINDQEYDISLDDAIQIYNEAYPSSSIESIEFDEDNGAFEYDFDGFDESNEYQLTIDATTGETTDQETDNEEDDNDDDALALDNIVSPQEAMVTALEEVESGHVDEWHLDNENGMTVYEISIDDSHEDDDDIIINAETGEFIKRD